MTIITENNFSENYVIELVSVSEALRKHFGTAKIKGTCKT